MALDPYGNYTVTIEPAPYTPGTSTRGQIFGSGAPDNSAGNNGNLYIDTDNGDVYVKYGDVWHVFQAAAGGSGEAGVGSPEGVVTAPVGTTYTDTGDGSFWAKVSGSGNTGWLAIVGPAF